MSKWKCPAIKVDRCSLALLTVRHVTQDNGTSRDLAQAWLLPEGVGVSLFLAVQLGRVAVNIYHLQTMYKAGNCYSAYVKTLHIWIYSQAPWLWQTFTTCFRQSTFPCIDDPSHCNWTWKKRKIALSWEIECSCMAVHSKILEIQMGLSKSILHNHLHTSFCII